MKTDLELKNFYNVEFGKTYKIIKSRDEDFFNLVGATFHLERRLSAKHGDLVCRVSDGSRMELNMLDDYTYEAVVPLLTPKEKEYLSGVIYPFKNRVLSITKFSNKLVTSEGIVINVEPDKAFSAYYTSEPIYLPYFKIGTMYKNLITDKNYTPKELGL